ncbi:MAG: sugar isomerase [Clostridia bacterium]|nr:sugar isomerase [Clostridia bacterium]
MRSKKALMNTVVSLLLQFVTAVCGFIVPRLIIGTYGSAVNGLTSSITQFLSYITLFEAGVGGVVRAALYKPLADNNLPKLSGIVSATERFFRKIAYIFIVYMAVVACVYPLIVNRSFGWTYTASLVVIIGISTFVQYYFGLTYMVFLQADQKRYITSTVQIITIILNTLLVLAFVKFGASIHLLKFGTALVYIIRPVALNIYVKKKYGINRKAQPDNSAISQRWDGLGHHIAYFVNLNTDVVILTLFSKITGAFSIAEVSVYTVYYGVVNGVHSITSALSTGMEAALGNMLAKGENDNLREKFGLYEFLSYGVTTFFFTCTAILIVPFVSVYTKGITDAEYIRPAFAYLLVAAYAAYTIRLPYNNLTLAAGHYKQTRNGAFVEAGINVVVSAVLVYFMGIIGVAIGTLSAMVFRTVQYAWYLSKNILVRSFAIFWKRVGVAAISAAISLALAKAVPHIAVTSYPTWAVFAVQTAVMTLAVTLIINYIFFRKDFRNLIKFGKKAFFSKILKK